MNSTLATYTGFLMTFLLGAACRWFEIPLPAPPTLGGAALILALTGGYVAGQWFHF